MIFITGDMVQLAVSDSEINREIVGKSARVIRQVSSTSPFFLDVSCEGVSYRVRGERCVKTSSIVAGIDEVGRGAFAGPLVIVAAAFRIPLTEWKADWPCPLPGIKDSKKYSSVSKREDAAASLLGYPGMVATGLGQVEHTDINAHGMTWAMRTAIDQAVAALCDKTRPDVILLDGNEKAASWSGPQQSIPKADDLWWPVSAASVIAKVYRDRLMVDYDKIHPGYGFGKNKGYGTPDHIAALQKLGPCPIHRTSFIRSSLGL